MIHKECGSKVEARGPSPFCPGCGKMLRFVDESKGLGKRRRFFITLTHREYCPHCQKMVSWVYLCLCSVEGFKARAWQCECGSILVLPENQEKTFGKIILVGPGWTEKDLDPYVKGRK